MEQTDITVIGAGPAGLMAAITAARLGAKTRLIEHKERVGNKILMTGNGKCNLTNHRMDKDCFYSDSGVDFYPVISNFNDRKLVSFFEELGVYTHERNGYVYPASEQASTILDALRFEAERVGVTILCDCRLLSIKEHFLLQTDKGQWQSKKIILAAGGKAAVKTGSDGSGYRLAEYFGHTLVRPIPALTQLKCSGDFFSELAGVRVNGELSVWEDSRLLKKEAGELHFADYGISGIPTFILSRVVLRSIEADRHPVMYIDFMPGSTEEEVLKRVSNCFAHNEELKAVEALNGLVPKKLASVVLKRSGVKPSALCKEVSEQEIGKIIPMIKSFSLKPYDSTGFEHAQVCAGGVNLKEIKLDSLESTKVSGLYFAGELLDVDGICGGYNLQWAFSSGYLAGNAAAHKALA